MISSLCTPCTIISPVLKFVDQHTLEHVSLVVDVMEHVFPEDVESGQRHEKAINAHPETVGKCRYSKGNDEDGEYGADEHDEGLCGYEIKEEPEDPEPEGTRGGLEADEPICDNGEKGGDEEEVGKTDKEIRECKGEWSTEAVCTLFRECSAVFEKGGNIGNSHERHECRAEEDGIDKGLDVCLRHREAEEDGTHQNGET